MDELLREREDGSPAIQHHHQPEDPGRNSEQSANLVCRGLEGTSEPTKRIQSGVETSRPREEVPRCHDKTDPALHREPEEISGL